MNHAMSSTALAIAASALIAGCASARSLAAEEGGGPVRANAPTVAMAVVDDSGIPDFERSLRDHLARSRRVVLTPVDRTRAAWQPSPGAAKLSNDEACALGRSLGVDTVVVAIANSLVREETACARSSILSVLGSGPARCVSYYKTGKYTAAVGVDLRSVGSTSCQEEFAYHVDSQEQGVGSAEGAFGLATREFWRKFDLSLNEAFPVAAEVVAADGARGHIDRGAAGGVERGQVFGVKRGGDVVGHVAVDGVDEREATVVAFTGDVILSRGDNLVESGTTCCIEVSPVVLGMRTNVGGTAHVGAGAGLQVALYRPITSLLVSSTLGLMDAGGDVTTMLWSIDAGWQWRLVPRRLAVYATGGAGAASSYLANLKANAVLAEATLGLKLRLRDNFWVTGEAAWLVATRMDTWHARSIASAGGVGAPPDVGLQAPVVRVGIGLRIP